MSGTQTSASAVLLLGDSRRAALIERMRVLLKTWASQWGVAALPELQIELLSEETKTQLTPRSAVTRLRCSLEGDALLEIDVRATVLDALMNLPCGRSPSASTPVGIAASLLDEVARSLADALTGAVQSKQWCIEPTATVATKSMTRGFALQVNLCAPTTAADVGADIELWLASNFVSRLLPVRGRPVALAKRVAAIGGEKIRLHAVLGETQVSVGELASLAVDDVLVMQDVAAPSAHLATPSGVRVANISLGRAGHKRAVQITALANQR